MTNLTIEQMEKIAERLQNATPDEITAMAQKMADERPDLLVGIPDVKERSEAFIKLELNNPNSSLDYIKGVIDGLWFAQLLTDDERKEYHNKAKDKKS